ncbi:hypothetical protein G6045_03195 [Streptomyces sp. YC504]|uniref:Uncharacterized protein n=1 Tax=Streptomyces mesophilus TaxID=1775132 RepID=A0A6G4XCY1_9ACTN|nr:hypothetical protein [Streptomyces mesophilus]NGO74697.1 hypothetical protein [Streptomyces mesophilus]
MAATAARSPSIPPHPANSTVPELVTGSERVDLAEAITELGQRHNAQVIRVDSGDSLTRARCLTVPAATH